MKLIKVILYKLTKYPRRFKQRLTLLTDIILVAGSLWLALALRMGNLFPVEYLIQDWYLFIVFPILIVSLFYYFGLYRSVLQYLGTQAIMIVVKSINLSTLMVGFSMMMVREVSFPRSVFIIFSGSAIMNIIGLRYFFRWLIYKFSLSKKNMQSVVIYGAGQAGSMLAENIRNSEKFNLVGIIDDDPDKQGTNLGSLRVHSTNKINQLVSEEGLELILLAIPSMGKSSRSKLLKGLSKYPINVMELPSIENIIDGKVTIDNFREVTVADILGRETVKPLKGLLKRNVNGKNIMITGAGGSIGSEMCRQIMKLEPKQLVLYENSEFNLYSIHDELNQLASNIKVIPVLGSVNSSVQLQKIFKIYSVHTVYHAAAYKHVPMVETNPCAGVWNNIIGTYHCAISAMENNVETFVLISTDKAVRPTNVMGATKRFAELILQGINGRKNGSTCFSMVRFGNVLDSAGSVVPKFRDQIKRGGPVTVTHKDVYRYFMSIPEAVQLVLQSGGMANGGEVFVLDMGEPVNILEMAKSMIFLSGSTPIDSKHPNGDIAIEIIGLRPGEKLYEELLIGDNVEKTEHPLIMKVDEIKLDWSVIITAIDEFSKACEQHDDELIYKLLKKYIPEYEPGVTSQMLWDKKV